MATGPWSDAENDAIVADYFAMLAFDLTGQPYIKAEHNRALQGLLGRPRGSIERKHQNISAVLMGMGENWIPGYKPLANFQTSLVDAVARWMLANPAWHIGNPINPPEKTLLEKPGIWIGPPPEARDSPNTDEDNRLAGVARRFDAAGRDARNRSLGKAGEELVLDHERATLAQAGRHDLAKGVRWISEEDGDGAGFDIASFTPEGRDRLIEVKTTNGGWNRTPFHITPNELAVAEQRAEHWSLVRVFNFARRPRAFELRPPLEDHVALTPTSYLARLR